MMTIIFDLDGTLVDSKAIVFPVFREVVGQFPNEPQPSQETLQKTFGNPDSVIWQMLMPNASEADRVRAFSLYEQVISRELRNQEFLIPGVTDMLENLHQAGHTLTVASNCGTDYLESVLDSCGLRHFFTNPLCLESVRGTQKADILAEHFKHVDKETAVMVGDRDSDMEAAAAHGIPAIGCLFGFGDEEELAGAKIIIRHPSELPTAIASLEHDRT